MTPLYTKTSLPPRSSFLLTRVPKFLLVVDIVIAIFYFIVIAFWFKVSNIYLFSLLIGSQVFFTWQGLTFIQTIWNTEYMPRKNPRFAEPVDVFITVAGEPVDIVEETVQAALDMDYPNFNVYILNDGYVAKKDNWRDMELMAERVGAYCITRTIAGGAKAGNINNGLRNTASPFIVIFDADHIPHRDFLQKTMGYFADPKVAFVQSPQYYKNYATNEVTGGSWEQQELFFGAILKGKNRLNSVTMCGTNMAIRRKPLEDVGGMCDTNIAEDFVTGLLIHQRGWKSVYVPEVLAEGLAPEDFLSYYKQQLRWARGSLEVLFKYNPIFKRGLTWSQKAQYLSSASYYLSGGFVLINAIIPLIFFFTGAVPFIVSTMALAIVFLPYMFLTLYLVQLSTNFSYTFRALAFSMSAWTIHLRALFELLRGKKSGFAITSKRAVEGNFVKLVIPHLLYFVIGAIAISYGVMREGLTASVATNTAWIILNCMISVPFIRAALPQRSIATEDIALPQTSPQGTQA
jgi:cellulose synthase (UDP-forming)